MSQLPRAFVAPRAFVVLALLAALACSGSPTDPSGLQVSPATVSVQTGNSVQLTVTGPSGGAVDGNITWTSSNPVAAQVDSAGVVTGIYANGKAMITATVSSGRADASVSTVPRICLAIAALHGTPDPADEIQTFDVEFDAGVNAAEKAAEMAARFGFVLLEVSRDGFLAELTPTQAGNVLCEPRVDTMTYL